MKRPAVFLLFALLCISANAQIVIDIDQINSTQNVLLKCHLLDSKTADPIPYATVYLIPHGDTTITHFALSDDKGFVEIEDIIPGKYDVNAEMIGYKPYKKEYSISGWEKNLGAIRLEENPEYIDAASITALGNPVTISQDTIIYNASAFHVGENAMLEDLLKKMPGMEVASDGTVKVNGEQVDKITVGGKTFFFNDPAMAVKNLPAKIVDKIKVVDKKTDEAEFTGVATKDDREKVMDVQLKEEYKKGWFGNLKAFGGSTAVPEEQKKDSGQPGMLFRSNGMLAGYNDTDQLTILGNALNVKDPSQTVEVLFDDFTEMGIDELARKNGTETSSQTGANYNTSRIKGFDTNLSVNYHFNQKDVREKSKRTSFMSSSPDFVTDGDYVGKGEDRKLNTSLEIENNDEDGKYMLYLRPSASFTNRDRSISNSSATMSADELMNESVSLSETHLNLFTTRTDYGFGIKDLGKERRSLNLTGSYNYRRTFGASSDFSTTFYNAVPDVRNLLYDNEQTLTAVEGVLTYVEPIGDKWAFQGRFTGCYIGSGNDKDAFNGADGSANDYYSACSDNDDRLLRERFLLQYEKDKSSIVFGAQLDQEENVTFSRSFGNESTVGEGMWMFNWSPYADIRFKKDNYSISLYYRGVSKTPSGTDIIPALNIQNPVQLSVGNIFLRPSFSQNCYASYRSTNPKTYTFYTVSLSGELSSNRIVSASWFDKDGNRYAFPVNAQTPGIQLGSYNTFQFPLDKEKKLSLSMMVYLVGSSYTSYQAKTALPGLDKDNFDYDDMMSRLWGEASGELFYSGKSGFAQSKTNSLTTMLQPSLTYKRDSFNVTLRADISNNVTKYSFNNAADMNTWDIGLYGEALYSAPKGWELGTDALHTTYRGYSAGYGDPEFIWNLSVSKHVKAVTLSIKGADILNQRKSLHRTASDEYMQDVYTGVIGRHILFGIAFNFGKMNAKNNQQAQNAMWHMVF